jgi:uncharacterized protein (TIGR02246 family)
MKNIIETSLSLSLMLLASFNCSAQKGQDEELVKKVVISFQDDFNEGSFKNADNYTTADWEHVNPFGGVTKSREEVLKEVRQVHQTFLKGVSTTIEKMTIRFITDDVAIADVIHKGSDFQTPDNIKRESPRLFKTYVMVKQKGKWLLTHDHATIISPM